MDNRSSAKARESLAKAMEGDADVVVHDLASFSHDDLIEAASAVPLILSAAAVARVLKDLERGRIPAAVAQSWASFAIRGYVAGKTTGPIMPLDIEFDAEREDAIVNALSRLEQLGDAIDGELTQTEIGRLAGMLLGA